MRGNCKAGGFYPPFMETYVDIIFIQDASGSFTNTMGDVKTSLKHMVRNLDLGTEANGYLRTEPW